jgi:hypothetical protein
MPSMKMAERLAELFSRSLRQAASTTGIKKSPPDKNIGNCTDFLAFR